MSFYFSEEDWKKKLTSEEYRVLRKHFDEGIKKKFIAPNTKPFKCRIRSDKEKKFIKPRIELKIFVLSYNSYKVVQP